MIVVVWVFPFPEKSCVEILTSSVMAIGVGPLWLGCEGKRSEMRAPCPFPPHEDTLRSLKPGSGPSPDHAGALILGFQLSEPWEINSCCLQVTQSVLFCYSSPNKDRNFINEHNKSTIIIVCHLWSPLTAPVLMCCLLNNPLSGSPGLLPGHWGRVEGGILSPLREPWAPCSLDEWPWSGYHFLGDVYVSKP